MAELFRCGFEGFAKLEFDALGWIGMKVFEEISVSKPDVYTHNSIDPRNTAFVHILVICL